MVIFAQLIAILPLIAAFVAALRAAEQFWTLRHRELVAKDLEILQLHRQLFPESDTSLIEDAIRAHTILAF